MACDQPLKSANFAFDECNCVANRDEPLRVSVVNSDAEFLFKRHDDLIEVDAVGPKVGEFGIFGQLRYCNREMERDNLPYLFSNIDSGIAGNFDHFGPPSAFFWKRTLTTVDKEHLPHLPKRIGAVTPGSHRRP